MRIGEKNLIESILGTTMEVEVAGLTTFGPHKAIIPVVSGSASFTGTSKFWFDPEDPLKDGFILR
jgi:trans-L-3-hydroxyproline dehydratase